MVTTKQKAGVRLNTMAIAGRWLLRTPSGPGTALSTLQAEGPLLLLLQQEPSSTATGPPQQASVRIQLREVSNLPEAHSAHRVRPHNLRGP